MTYSMWISTALYYSTIAKYLTFLYNMKSLEVLQREVDYYFNNTIYTVIGVEAVNFFRDNFKRQGFLDGELNKWKPVKSTKNKRNKDTILHELGNLKKGIRWERGSAGQTVIIYNDEPYAEIHNEGGKITGVFQVNEHFRRTKNGKVKVRAHIRNVNTTIPQRQFMGASKELKEHLEKVIIQDLENIFNS